MCLFCTDLNSFEAALLRAVTVLSVNCSMLLDALDNWTEISSRPLRQESPKKQTTIDVSNLNWLLRNYAETQMSLTSLTTWPSEGFTLHDHMQDLPCPPVYPQSQRPTTLWSLQQRVHDGSRRQTVPMGDHGTGRTALYLAILGKKTSIFSWICAKFWRTWISY